MADGAEPENPKVPTAMGTPSLQIDALSLLLSHAMHPHRQSARRISKVLCDVPSYNLP